MKITKIEILNRQGEQALGKPKGRYITVESTSFAGDYSINPDCLLALKTEIVRLLPETGPVLICRAGSPAAGGSDVSGGAGADRCGNRRDDSGRVRQGKTGGGHRY